MAELGEQARVMPTRGGSGSGSVEQTTHSLTTLLRRDLPHLFQEAETQLSDFHACMHAWERRACVTRAPAQTLDGTPLLPPDTRLRYIAHEAVFAYLLSAVFLEALNQGMGLRCTTADLYGAVPELAAYDWFQPSHDSWCDLHTTLVVCPLWPIPMDLASDVYQESLTREEKRMLGQYYTPRDIARHLLSQAGYVQGGITIERCTVLDVATGFGIFLAEATKRLLDVTKLTHLSLSDILDLLGRSLHGYDVQPFAIIATKLHLLATVIHELDLDSVSVALMLKHIRFSGIHVGDTLAGELQAADNPIYFVVGNPPYGACRPGPHLDRYKDALSGRANLYQLFLYYAVRRCAEGGMIALLVPESMRSGQYFHSLRRFLTQETTLVAVTDLLDRSNIFIGVEQGVHILSVRKEKLRLSTGHETVTVMQATSTVAVATSETMTVPHRHVQAGEDHAYVYLKAASTDLYALLARLRDELPPLPRITLDTHTGPFVWNQHKEGLVSEEVGAVDRQLFYPIIYAPCVHRYKFVFPPEATFIPCQQRLYARHSASLRRLTRTGPSLVLQRTTSREQIRRLVATLIPAPFTKDHNGYLVENHVNYISCATSNGDAVPLLYVLGILNSQILNMYFSSINGNTHVSAYELGLLPILYDEDAGLEDIVARRLQAEGVEANALDEDIDEQVARIYGLSDADITLVAAHHDTYHKEAKRP